MTSILVVKQMSDLVPISNQIYIHASSLLLGYKILEWDSVAID